MYFFDKIKDVRYVKKMFDQCLLDKKNHIYLSFFHFFIYLILSLFFLNLKVLSKTYR